MSKLLLLAVMFTGASLLNGQFMLVNKAGNNLCLAVRDGKIANNSTLMLWDCGAGDPSQVFVFDPHGVMRIGSANSQYCVAAYDGGKRGARVGVWQCQLDRNGSADPSQSFSPGIYANVQGTGGLCPSPLNGTMTRGTPIILWDCSTGAALNQNWTFRSASAPAPSPMPPTVVPPQSVPNLGVKSGDFISHNGSAFISGLDSQGHLLNKLGQIIAAAGAANYFINVLTNRLVATGGGNYTAWLNGAAMLVASGGGNLQGVLVNSQGLPYRLVASGGGNLQMYHSSGALVASGGGNLVASGGGNLVATGGGNLVATGGGNFIDATPAYAAQLSHLTTAQGISMISGNGGSFTDPGYLMRMIPTAALKLR